MANCKYCLDVRVTWACRYNQFLLLLGLLQLEHLLHDLLLLDEERADDAARRITQPQTMKWVRYPYQDISNTPMGPHERLPHTTTLMMM